MLSKMQFLSSPSLLLCRSTCPEPCFLLGFLWGFSWAVADRSNLAVVPWSSCLSSVCWVSLSLVCPLSLWAAVPFLLPVHGVTPLSKSSNRFTEWSWAAFPGIHVQVLPYSDTLYGTVQLATTSKSPLAGTFLWVHHYQLILGLEPSCMAPSMLSFTKKKNPNLESFWKVHHSLNQELFVASWYVATCCWNPSLAGLQEQVFPVVFVTDAEHCVLMLDTLPKPRRESLWAHRFPSASPSVQPDGLSPREKEVKLDWQGWMSRWAGKSPWASLLGCPPVFKWTNGLPRVQHPSCLCWKESHCVSGHMCWGRTLRGWCVHICPLPAGSTPSERCTKVLAELPLWLRPGYWYSQQLSGGKACSAKHAVNGLERRHQQKLLVEGALTCCAPGPWRPLAELAEAGSVPSPLPSPVPSGEGIH